MSHIQSTINDIINEIKDINRINHTINNNIELVPYNNNNNNNNNNNGNDNGSTEDITQLIQSISSCSSIAEFTKNVLSVSSDKDNNNNNNNDTIDNNPSINDFELLSMLSRHSKQMKAPYDGLDSFHISVDVDQLNRIKKQLETSFCVYDEDLEHTYYGHIIAVGMVGISSFSLRTLKWTPIEGISEKPPRNTYQATV
ncbi:hypothetical protein SAMD00019534_085950 [Acytostelium subglobosum LB1]|uniref:hypothetical protein n=1 Tax=Acytostelium subglobosum LB1 TaxID=1410327 RepID=UPI000644BBC3|nr:hypothetical protein SAMD00019534_085950 [Acytostelium subglobosum LB1]GAM25420.1 hypothetical protein SAMD00019534_085950 [Acytostelium subglobosum LB1]|eukprot:XP_012751406.1 hypothetical protein SAMD00019534_085950 [Acytostelium subglobosum LB1]